MRCMMQLVLSVVFTSTRHHAAEAALVCVHVCLDAVSRSRNSSNIGSCPNADQLLGTGRLMMLTVDCCVMAKGVHIQGVG